METKRTIFAIFSAARWLLHSRCTYKYDIHIHTNPMPGIKYVHLPHIILFAVFPIHLGRINKV